MRPRRCGARPRTALADPQGGQPVRARGQQAAPRGVDLAVAPTSPSASASPACRSPPPRPPRPAARDRRGRSRRRTRAGPPPARTRRRGPARPRSARRASRRAPPRGSARARSAAAAAPARAARRSAGSRRGLGIGGQRAAAERGRRGRRPDHLVEDPVDALGGEVRERTAEVEQELDARGAIRCPAARASRAALRSASLITSPIDPSLVELRTPSVRFVPSKRSRLRKLAGILRPQGRSPASAECPGNQTGRLESGYSHAAAAPPGSREPGEVDPCPSSAPQAPSVRPVVPRRAGPRSRGRQVDAVDHP